MEFGFYMSLSHSASPVTAFCYLTHHIDQSIRSGGARGQSGYGLPWKLKAVITSRKLFHMPVNAVCRLQISPNRPIAGASPRSPFLRETVINGAYYMWRLVRELSF